MKKYNEPEIDITMFSSEDILVTSGVLDDNNFDVGTGVWE